MEKYHNGNSPFQRKVVKAHAGLLGPHPYSNNGEETESCKMNLLKMNNY